MPEKAFLTRPLYLQVRDALAEQIAKGELKPGSAIPNESDLARQWGVSPGTMRKALDQLEAERLVTRRQGRGTFINDSSTDELANRFVGIRGPDGQRVVGNVLCSEANVRMANDHERARLELAEGESVCRLRRLRSINERAFLLVEATVPCSLFPGVESMTGDTGRIASLARHYGILLGKAEERVCMETASGRLAEALKLADGTPIIMLDRIVRATDGRPVEWRVAWCQLTEGHYYLAMM